MGGHAGGLVDHDQVRILVEDRQGDSLGLRGCGRGRGHHDGVEAGQGLGRAAGQNLAVTADGAVGQQRLEARARQGGKSVRQGLVQADAGCVDARFQPLAQRGVQSGVQRRVFVVDQIRVGHAPS